jgi:hypothetical protein
VVRSNLVKLRGQERPCLVDKDEIDRGLAEGVIEYVCDPETGERLDEEVKPGGSATQVDEPQETPQTSD